MWANPDEFLLDADGRPTVVAGVPPDYFSDDGQHWGNPIYDWDRMAETGYAWWAARMRRHAHAGGPDPARPLPRLPPGLAHPRRRDRRPRAASGWTGPGRSCSRAAPPARRAAAHRRGPGPHHPGRGRPPRRARAAGHEGAAVRPGHAAQPVLAAQLRAALRVLHRHPRQRHRQRLVRDRERDGPPLPGRLPRPPHRQRGLGPDAAGVVVGGGRWRWPRCRTCSASAARRG